MNPTSAALLKEFVPAGAYRAQALRHLSTLSVSDVLSIFGTDASMNDGRNLYVCHIVFAEALRQNYNYSMDSVRVSYFSLGG